MSQRNKDLNKQPSAQQAYALGVEYATLLRAMHSLPAFKYVNPPTAEICQPDLDKTPLGLFWVTDFVENTYVQFVIPMLPAGATRKCKDLANPWAYADAGYNWEWSWDETEGKMKDKEGKEIAFPTLGKGKARQLQSDLVGREFMASKLVLENETDIKAKMMMGGKSFDFGQEVREMVRKMG